MNDRRWVPALVLLLLVAVTMPASAQERRAMTFMDVIDMQSIGNRAVSPDGDWMLYTRSITDWEEGRDFTDLYLVSVDEGISSSRQMTYTQGKNENAPEWSMDSSFFVFRSDRESDDNQLYMMRRDGGEARRITDAEGGVSRFAFSEDGNWLAFTGGEVEDRDVWVIDLADIDTPATKLIDHYAPVIWWGFSPDSSRVYFLAPDRVDERKRDRMKEEFNVMVRNEDVPQEHLWEFDMDSREATQVTTSSDYSTRGVTISRDSKWIGFQGVPNDRYMRTVTESGIYSDLYLLEVATGHVERLTENEEVGESGLSFSPDSSTLAFSASNDFTYNRDRKIWLRRVSDRAGSLRKLGGGYDGSVSVGFWSKDGGTIYSNAGIGATRNVLAIDVASGQVSQITDAAASLSLEYDRLSDSFKVNYSDPVTPPSVYAIASLGDLANRDNWKRLTNSNPQVDGFTLGETEAVTWMSTDGKMVEGVLVKPVNYEPGRRYPLVVQIHGGPASATVQSFNASHGYYSHIYAAAGYMCLLPNYRGSSNYGEEFRTEIIGDYFRQGYEDIMAGVDHLIAEGMVDPDRLGAMGWSAGGHWSNWILTHTNRFKAISSGAGTMNWVSMYAQSDVQRNRQNYFGVFPYDDFEALWDISPLKYINNAETPTLVHVVDGDPRVPRPQSEELHMALKKLGVPTEFFVYPGQTHGIPTRRNQMVKMVSEFNWFEKYINGQEDWFDWEELLKTLPARGGEGEVNTTSDPQMQ